MKVSYKYLTVYATWSIAPMILHVMMLFSSADRIEIKLIDNETLRFKGTWY